MVEDWKFRTPSLQHSSLPKILFPFCTSSVRLRIYLLPSQTLMNDDQDLLILTRFLNRFDPDVEGRAAEPPPADVAARLDRFAAGEADAAERGSVAGLLKEHPEWVRYLAGAIRKRA